MKLTISVQAQIELQGDLSLVNISQKIDEINIPKQILQTTLIKLQDTIVLDLCDTPYQKNPNRQYQRAGTTKRTLKTRHGTIQFILIRLRDLQNGTYFRPLLLYLGLLSKQRVVDDLDLECAEAASYLTYRDSKTVIENLTMQRFLRVEFMLVCKRLVIL